MKKDCLILNLQPSLFVIHNIVNKIIQNMSDYFFNDK